MTTEAAMVEACYHSSHKVMGAEVRKTLRFREAEPFLCIAH